MPLAAIQPADAPPAATVAWPQLQIPPRLAPPLPAAPWTALPALPYGQRMALADACQRANDKYLIDFVEEYGFCPYARKGRRLGQVHRYVHYADSTDVLPLVRRMHAIAADRRQVVVQVVLPMVEVEPRAWVSFVQALTDHANFSLARDDRMGTAALHPQLAYSDLNAFSLIPLFRRAPDATIQWVRLDAVRALYAGREGGTRAVALEDIDALLAQPLRTPLYDRIAATNATMARRLRLEVVDGWLAEMHAEARRAYEAVLFDQRWDGEPAVLSAADPIGESEAMAHAAESMT